MLPNYLRRVCGNGRSRRANGAAHHLAKLALEQDDDIEWRDGFPSHIQDIEN
jgi:hypothetical protein